MIPTSLKDVVILTDLFRYKKVQYFNLCIIFRIEMYFYFSVIVILSSIVTGSPSQAAHAGGPPLSEEVSNNDKYIERKKRAFWNLPINVNEWLYNNDDFYDDLIYSSSHTHN